MKSLFGKNDTAGFALVEHFGAIHVGGELLDVFEGDAGGIGGVGGGFIGPGFAIEEIFGIRVEREVPIEIAAL